MIFTKFLDSYDVSIKSTQGVIATARFITYSDFYKDHLLFTIMCSSGLEIPYPYDCYIFCLWEIIIEDKAIKETEDDEHFMFSWASTRKSD